MNDDELTPILRSGDRPVALPPQAATRIRTAIHAELDSALEPGGGIAVLDQDDAHQRQPGRIAWLAAAAIIILVGVGGLVLTNNTKTETPTETPQPYLIACLDFIEATTTANQPWPEILATADTNQLSTDYLDQLATALDQLLTNPGVAPAISDLRAAAAETRLSPPNIGAITDHLNQARTTLRRTTGLPCLTETAQDP